MRPLLRATALALTVLTPALAWPCSLAQRPAGLELLTAQQPVPPVGDAGTDATPPSKPVLSNPTVTLFDAPCDGSGISCPQLDFLTVTVDASDDQVPAERLRYVAYFGDTAEAVMAATAPEARFGPDPQSSGTVTAWLGLGGARNETGFQRARLCFALAAVDEAANVSPRSEVTCLDTTSRTAATTTLRQGNLCGVGCGCTSPAGAAPLMLLALAVARRRRAGPSSQGPGSRPSP